MCEVLVKLLPQAGVVISGYKHTNLTMIYINQLVATALMDQAQCLKLACEAAMDCGFFPHLDVLCTRRPPGMTFVIQTADVVWCLLLFLLLVLTSSALSCCYPRLGLTAAPKINQDKQC